MARPITRWIVTERHKERLEDWIGAATGAHDNFVFTANESVAMTLLDKPIKESRVALVTTAGVHLRSQDPYDTKSALGDPSFRAIPSSATHGELTVSDTHFNTEGAELDINCLFPVDRIRELADSGAIGSVASTFYGFMGFNPNPSFGLMGSAKNVASLLANDQVDIAIFSPG